MMQAKWAVAISKMYKTFKRGKSSFDALRGVDLEVGRGEIFGFLGPNGAGKTTTLRILTTLLTFERGEAFVEDIDINKNPSLIRRKVGYVSQKGGADRRATGWENLILQGQLHGMSKREAIEQATLLIETFALKDCIHRLVSSYSGGQQRRLDISLGMMHRPGILFLDEPTTGLDPQSRDNLWSMIRKLKEKGVTVFLTSHYLDEVDALADNLAIMDHGRIVARGSPSQLKSQISGDIVTIGIQKEFQARALSLFEKQNGFVKEVMLGEETVRLSVDKGEAALPLILRLLDQEGIRLETIQMSIPTLNDVFLKKTGRLLREEN